MPTSAVAIINTAKRMTAVMPWPRVRKVRAVAQASAASTNSCHGCSESLSISRGAAAPLALVEISELIVEACLQFGIDSGRCLPIVRRPMRPLDGGKADADCPGRGHQI